MGGCIFLPSFLDFLGGVSPLGPSSKTPIPRLAEGGCDPPWESGPAETARIATPIRRMLLDASLNRIEKLLGLRPHRKPRGAP